MSGTRYRAGSTSTGNTRSSPGASSPIWSAASSASTAQTTVTEYERARRSAAYNADSKRHEYDADASADASASIDSGALPSDSDSSTSSSSTDGDDRGTRDSTARRLREPEEDSRDSLSSVSVNSSELDMSSSDEHVNAQVHVPARRPGQPVFEGFWQVRSLDDLRPLVDSSALMTSQRRADPSGGHVSPLKALTSYLHHTYHLVNPAFVYELAFNPRRVLTKPSKPVYNDGYDNEDSDYILYVNDWLGSEDGNRYLILDVLGQGTFGQVVKCQNMTTHEIVAVKVIKNKTAYFNQSMMEVTILETLNQHWDADDEHNILRLHDTFIHRKHLCLVFELLSSNLYELIKQNSFRGLSTSLVRVFTTQLLDALTVLKEARLIHCDLKPENILLRTLQAPSIKLVDFGSACHEQQTVYTYIQSRFYRSPEVLLGLPYTAAIDMWSLGCIAVELFLGLPIFPGTSEYNQLSRIVEMLGLPPQFMLDAGRQTGEFFNVHEDAIGRTSYRLKSREQYSREHNVQEQPSKQYFPGTTLPEIVRLAPVSRRSGRTADIDKEMANRTSFIDFVSGLLNINPLERWTPQQAKLHPFITGEPFTQPWQPPSVIETPGPEATPPRRTVGRASRSSTITAADVAGKHVYPHPAAASTSQQGVHVPPPSVLPAAASAYAPPLTRHSYAPPDDFALSMQPMGYYSPSEAENYYGAAGGISNNMSGGMNGHTNTSSNLNGNATSSMNSNINPAMNTAVNTSLNTPMNPGLSNAGGHAASSSSGAPGLPSVQSMPAIAGVQGMPLRRMSVAGQQAYSVYPSVGSGASAAAAAAAAAAPPPTAPAGSQSHWQWTSPPPPPPPQQQQHQQQHQVDAGYRQHAASAGFAVVVHGNDQYAMPAEMSSRPTSQYDVYSLPTHYDNQGAESLAPPTANEQYARRRYSSAPQHVLNMYDHRDPGVLPLYMHHAPPGT
ncbi:dual-specificity kinase [Malassezia cuniculi]|uniref:Dual-specificity kinase n=1 Tax=Malassezia cuniculi TaxID=948313 RepID=A0AAF0EYD8_9BASI|nr:dual-specificity kinase [Malassezia cuniculi]